MAASRAANPIRMRWLLLATMALWGLNLPVMKLLLPVFGTLGTPVLRMLAACVLLSLVAWWRHRAWRRSESTPTLTSLAAPHGGANRLGATRRRLSLRQWSALVACGAVMIYLNQVLLMEGMQRTSATHAALIMALNPLMASLLAAGLLGVPLTRQRLSGVALGFGGVALVILKSGQAAAASTVLGDALVIAAILAWVVGGVMVQRLADPTRGSIDSDTVSWAVNVVGLAMLVLHLAWVGGPLIESPAAVSGGMVLLLVLSGVLSTAVGALVWNRALATLGVAHVSLYVYWVPIFGVAFSVLLLGEPLTVWHVIGLVAVLAGTWLGTRGAARSTVPAGE